MKRKKPGEAARTFLREIRISSRRIKLMEEHADFLRSMAYPGALRLKQVQVQEPIPQDTMSAKLAALDAISRRILAESENALLARRYAEEVIGDIQDKRQRRVLTLYYMSVYPTYEELGASRKAYEGFVNLRWPDVANEMHMRLREVHEIHREALIAFEAEAYLPEEYYWED